MSTTPSRRSGALRLYGWLLELYPAEFRQEYGREMAMVFQERHAQAAADGLLALAALWVSVCKDTAWNATAVHVDIARRDVRFAWRGLCRDKAFTWSAGATLTLGIGAALTGVAIVSAVLLRPMPYPDATSIIALSERDPKQSRWGFAEPTFLELRDQTRTLKNVSAFRLGRGAISLPEGTESVSIATISPSMVPLLGLHPIAGHLFGPDADRASSGVHEVLLSEHYWRQSLQSQPDLVTSSIAVNGVPHVVAGIIHPPAGLFDEVDIFVPLQADPQGSRTARDLDVLASVVQGMTPVQAEAELGTLASNIARLHPASDEGWSIRSMDLRTFMLGPYVTRIVWSLVASVALLWALACVNIAGLVTARMTVTQRELGVRTALGASRARLLREIVTGAGVLAGLGGALGLGCAFGLCAVIRRVGPALLAQLADVRVDGRTIGAALMLIVGSALWCGALPALSLRQVRTKDALANGGRAGSARRRTRAVLVGTQVAMALMLVAAAGLLLQSYGRLATVNPGFDPDHVLTVHLSMNGPGLDAPRRVQRLSDVTVDLARLPGVQAVGASSVSPLGQTSTANRFRIEGSTRTDEYFVAAWRSVTPGYFRALGVPLIRGRLFDDRDAGEAEQVVVITESMAARFWPDRDPLGLRLLWGSSGNPKRIVGIVRDLRDIAIGAEPMPTMFRPYTQLTPPDMSVMVRTDGEPDGLISTIRGRLRELAPDVPARIEPLARTVSTSILRPRISAWVFAVFGTAALVLATVGLYGLVSYDVVHRRRDTAIRRALGASNATVLRDLGRGALVTAAVGAAVGLTATLALSQLMQTVLFGTNATDPRTLAGVTALLLGIAWIAARTAARSALRINASEALRSE